MQEPAFAEPAALLDEHAVHHRDLPGRPAEAVEPDKRPHFRGVGEADAVRRRRWRSVVVGHAGSRPVNSSRRQYS